MGCSSSKVPVAEPQPVAGGRTAPPGAGDKVTATVPKVSIEPTATQPTIQKLYAPNVYPSPPVNLTTKLALPPVAAPVAAPVNIEPTATQPTILRNYAPNVYPSPPVAPASVQVTMAPSTPRVGSMPIPTSAPVAIIKEEQADEPGLLAKFGSWFSESLSSLFGGLDTTAIVAVTALESTSAAKPSDDSASTPLPSYRRDRVQRARAAFREMDKNGDGKLSRAEVIKACRSDASIRELLGLPAVVRQEDGTREAFEAVFQAIDRDGSKAIDEAEFVAYFASADYASPNGGAVAAIGVSPAALKGANALVAPMDNTRLVQEGMRAVRAARMAQM